ALLGPCAGAAPTTSAAHAARDSGGTRPAVALPARAKALDKELAIDVRSAPLADVVEGIAAAGGVPLRLGRALKPSTSTGAGDQRITLYADRAWVGEFQRVAAALLHLHWMEEEPALRPEKPAPAGPPGELSYTLEEDAQVRAQASALRRRQASH